MKDLTRETLTKIYSKLKFMDHSNRSYFDNDKMSNVNYLYLALHEDLVSHGLAVLINYFHDNLDSPSVDLNIRSILETLALLTYIETNPLDDFQYDLFRKHHVLVEMANREKLMRHLAKDDDFKTDELLRTEIISSIAKYFSTTGEEVEKMIDKNDPLFIFNGDRKEDFRFSSLIRKQLGEDYFQYYQFLSIITHPHSFGANKTKIFDLRNIIVEGVLRLLNHHIDGLDLSDVEITIISPLDEVEGPIRKMVYEGIQTKIDSLKEILEEMGKLPKGFAFTSCENDFVNYLISIVKDMDLCELYGFNEQVTAKFKTFAEFSAILTRFAQSDSRKEWVMVQNAFQFSSIIQSQLVINKIYGYKDSIDEELIKYYFHNYYQEAYKIDYATFKTQFIYNSLYSINKNATKNYKNLVKISNDWLETDQTRRDINSFLYSVSLDLGHGGGYLFSSSESVWTSAARFCLEYTARYMKKYLLLRSIALTNANIESNFSSMLNQLFSAFSKDLVKFDIQKREAN